MSALEFPDLIDRFSHQLNAFRQAHAVTGWCVALSGGLDSRVLLQLLLASDCDRPIRVIHVHHGVSDSAEDWLNFCRRTCEQLSRSYQLPIEFVAHRVTVSSSGSFEEQARVARYHVFESCLRPGEALLMGHHANDQVETFFQRLIRGAGLIGLAAMPASRPLGEGVLFRPLLQEPRHLLQAYAEANQLHWVEDESNASHVHDRNYLRHRLLPILTERWPQALSSISRTLTLIGKESDSLSFYRDHWLKSYSQGDELNLVALEPLPVAEQQGILSHWVRKVSGYSLSAQQIATLLSEVVNAKQDAQAVFRVGSLEYRRYQQRLYRVKPQAIIESDWRTCVTLQPGVRQDVKLPDDSVLTFEPSEQGLSFPDDTVEIGYRQGGETFKPQGDRHTRVLKKWLQEQGIPPWRRSNVPLLYCNQQLVAVADLACDQSCSQQKGPLSSGQTRWKLKWQH